MPSQVSFTLPGSEYQAEADRIARQRRMAEALQADAVQPLEMPKTPGVHISPFDGLAKMLKAYTGAVGQRRADAANVDLANQVAGTRSADLKFFADALRGRQATPGGLVEDASGNVTQADPLPAMKPSESLAQATSMLRTPELQSAALSASQAAAGREAQQAFQTAEAAANREARLQERLLSLESASALAQGNRDFQERLAKQKNEIMLEIAKLRETSGGRPFYTFLSTPNGIVAGNGRTGTVSPVALDGKPVVKASDSPALQGDIAEAKAGGKEKGTAQAQAQVNLPQVEANATQAINLIDQMIGSEDGKIKAHPGFEGVVGATYKPGFRFIPGTAESDFQAMLDQVKGKAFLEAFQSLRGGGQITEVEGKKATDAITRMKEATSEAAFKSAAREFQSIIRGGVERAKKKAGGTAAAPAQAVPEGVDPALWAVMTPQERAAFNQ